MTLQPVEDLGCPDMSLQSQGMGADDERLDFSGWQSSRVRSPIKIVGKILAAGVLRSDL